MCFANKIFFFLEKKKFGKISLEKLLQMVKNSKMLAILTTACYHSSHNSSKIKSLVCF